MGSFWWTRRAVGLHLTVVVLVPTFLALGRWQLHRALSGNGLSWAYTFEWPFFAIYAVVLWWKLVHEQPGREVTRTKAGANRQQGPPEAREEAERAAYNAYLASLRAEDAKRSKPAS